MIKKNTVSAMAMMVAVLLLWCGAMVAEASNKQANNKQPSDSDLPKLVSLRWRDINVRKGPSKSFPTTFSLHEKGLPLILTRRHGDWREVMDWEKSKGWVLRDALSDEKTLMINVGQTSLLSAPMRDSNSRAISLAILKKGVTAKIISCEAQWCHIETFVGKKTGWVRLVDSTAATMNPRPK
ncbi:MAG: SH3 domain-containing protein [Alphaproteobacteria bacterium]|nr:SH3 domain-containing protein [Alphaproteobacteria bacterium]